MGIVLPPRPDEITEDTEVEALQTHVKPKVQTTRESRIIDYGTNDSTSGPTRSPTIMTQVPTPTTSPVKNIRSNTSGSISSVNSVRSSTDVGSIHPEMDIGILRQLHANLDARLQPFWSSKLDNREVRIKLYAQPPDSTPRRSLGSAPLAVALVRTNAQGYFSHTFSLSFEELCTHDQTLHIAFGDHNEEHTFSVHAELLPFAYALDSDGAGAEMSRDIEIGSEAVGAQTELPLTSARIRLISDIDDTVKISEVLMGVRAIFHNVSRSRV
jgi:hypothetical protein